MSNLIQVFQSLPEAAALGLVLSEKNTGKPNLVRLSQSWSRFILQQISKVLLISSHMFFVINYLLCIYIYIYRTLKAITVCVSNLKKEHKNPVICL